MKIEIATLEITHDDNVTIDKDFAKYLAFSLTF